MYGRAVQPLERSPEPSGYSFSHWGALLVRALLQPRGALGGSNFCTFFNADGSARLSVPWLHVYLRAADGLVAAVSGQDGIGMAGAHPPPAVSFTATGIYLTSQPPHHTEIRQVALVLCTCMPSPSAHAEVRAQVSELSAMHMSTPSARSAGDWRRLHGLHQVVISPVADRAVA